MLNDILDLVNQIRHIDDYIDEDEHGLPDLRALSKRSASRLSNDGIFQFPCLIDAAMEFDTLLMISKALEREYMTFLRVAIGLDDIRVDDDFSKRAYLKSIHQNLGQSFNAGQQIQAIIRENANLAKPFKNIYNMKTLNEMCPVEYSKHAKRLFKEHGIQPYIPLNETPSYSFYINHSIFQ